MHTLNVTRQSSSSIDWIWKGLVLSVVLCVLSTIDFARLRFGHSSIPNLLFVSVLRAGVFSWLVVNSHWRGWKLVASLFSLMFGVMTLMTAIETVYLPETLPLSVAGALLVNGAITSALFSLLVVWLWGKMTTQADPQPVDKPQPRWSYLWRLPLLGLLYGILFVVFGAVVFMGIAKALAPADLANYTNLNMPPWVLPFQLLRGLLWALLALPAARMLQGSRWLAGLMIGLAFMVLMGGNMLLATNLPGGILAAHIAELGGESLVFGLLVGLVLK